MDARTADFRGYDSVRSPEGNTADWPAFYAQADRASERVRARLKHRSHVLYGEDPYQLLNVFEPESRGSGSSRPVFLFVHGGAFSEGHPDHYDFLAAPLSALGALYVGVGYRLLPAGSPRDAVGDVAKAIGWVYRHLVDIGHPAGNVYLGGHSAGAILSAILGTRADWQAAVHVPPDVLRGVVLVSGTYYLRDRAPAFGLTVDQAEGLEPGRNLVRAPPRALIAYGSEEAGRLGPRGPRFLQSNLDLARRLREKGTPVTLLELGGADHAEVVHSLGEACSPLFQQVAGMLSSGTPPDGPPQR